MAVADTTAPKLGLSKVHDRSMWTFAPLSVWAKRWGKYKQRSSTDWIVFGKGYDKVQAFRGNVENFCAAIDGKAMPLINVDDAVASVDVIAAAYRSMKSVRWEPVKLPVKAAGKAA
jgi:predicted dehydrogenase